MKNNLIEYCLNKKGAIKDYPSGPDPIAIKIAGKIFALFFEKKGYLVLKCDPVIAENLREQYEDIRPGYHMNKKHWNTIILGGSLQESFIFEMIDHSYNSIVKALPKNIRE
ncbi:MULTISPECIES: MmcQ/YjbR family DNA-binding protein [unclassified Paenibacillus]|uniref:MmcQ/YjbR family DNA-binding protein n=1 Tax=unclassified Paenibacillus TaxID=185978 RepID=UPI0010522480|nr:MULTISPECIES: MmcQ/YjbR family DNA-binding protein [unclassified Paenibacillus]NIK66957.1 putative DNA-binding protein (MmcQ/YjbR family) [Paenibacillus sp. BK720]TCN01006.1 putative DNA-binding protein (MmcQ/YjbR family) [Paenibacillus sp. BK033]